MALGEAILVCLTERPMSGYDLAKNFDASIGFFWKSSHQQIYRELGKLREKGLVNSKELKQSGKPNRIVHTIDIDISALLEQIALRIEQHQSKLVTFKRIKERYYDDKTLSVNQKGKLIALEMGIKEETNRIQLLQTISEKIRAF